MKPSSRSGVDTENLLRALAIAAVVLNHAHSEANRTFFLGYGGGMAFLLMLAGFNFARFSIHNGTPDHLRSATLRLARNIFLPSLGMVIFSSLLFADYRILEWLFISNWFTAVHPRIFHLWYPEVVIQMMLALWLFFRIPRVARIIIDRPLSSALLLFLLALFMRSDMAQVWNPPELEGRLPHLWLWDFFLGWLLFFATRTPLLARLRGGQLLALGCAAAGGLIVFGPDKLDFWWLVGGTALMVGLPRIALPEPGARLVHIMSQAAFTIFLIHGFFLEAWRQVHLPDWAAAQWLFAIGGSVATWLVATACVRAYRVVGAPNLRWGGPVGSAGRQGYGA